MGGNQQALEHGIIADMSQPAPKPNGNGGPPAEVRYVEVYLRVNLDNGALDAKVVPPEAVTNRLVMYGMLEMMRDIVYRHALPDELARLQAAASKQIVVAPDGAVPHIRRG